MSKVGYVITDEFIVITHGGISKTYLNSDPQYHDIINLIKQGKTDELINYKSKSIENYIKPLIIKDFQIVDPDLNEELPLKLQDKIFQFFNLSLPFDYLLKFWQKLKENPSKQCRQTLFDFLDDWKFPITPDGDIIAYKGVRSDLKDSYSGTVQYVIGKPTSMPREKCNDDPNVTCGSGLHVGTYEYATGFGNIVIEVLVNPKHVVSVPTSETNKCRCCELTPVRICEGKYVEDKVSFPSITKIGNNEYRTKTINKIKNISKLRKYSYGKWPKIFKENKAIIKQVYKGSNCYYVVTNNRIYSFRKIKKKTKKKS